MVGDEEAMAKKRARIARAFKILEAEGHNDLAFVLVSPVGVMFEKVSANGRYPVVQDDGTVNSYWSMDNALAAMGE